MKKLSLCMFLVVVLTGCATMTDEEWAAYQKRKAQERAACDKAFAACFFQNGGVNGARTLEAQMHNITIANLCKQAVRCDR